MSRPRKRLYKRHRFDSDKWVIQTTQSMDIRTKEIITTRHKLLKMPKFNLSDIPDIEIPLFLLKKKPSQ